MADAEEFQPLLTDDVRELLRLITQADISEIKIERGDTKIHIKRALAQASVVNMIAAPDAATSIPATILSQAASVPSVVPAATNGDAAPAVPSGIPVTAPMVGTYYASPAPKEPSYVHVGDEVRPGDVLGIIEAMKIMNEIECEIAGHVREILVESGQPVEYGQTLMIVEPL